MFIPVTKIDEEQRMVYGVGTDETPDLAGEITDYKTTKPLIEEWSESFRLRTAGKSLGNVRGQHSMTEAAGVVKQLEFNDEAKSVSLGVKVVDDEDWAKVKEGVYTGFSIGGKYVTRKAEPGKAGLTRVTIKPSEFSLVDSPCNPAATFQAVKADGRLETVAFKTAKRPDVNPKEGESEYGDVEFADAKNKKYPIDTEAHIRAAWNYINEPKNAEEYSAADVKGIKDRIVAAWKKVIDKDGPPSAEKAAASRAKLVGGCARKGIFTLMQVADILEALACIHDAVTLERSFEGDDSDEPERLGEIIEALGEFFLDAAEEETTELLAAHAA